MPSDNPLADVRRKQIAEALAHLAPERARALRARLEMAAPPLAGYEEGRAGFVVEETVIAAARPLIILKKGAYLAETDDTGDPIWRYGLFAPEDFPDPRRRPQGEAFWTSERSWKGLHDPELAPNE